MEHYKVCVNNVPENAYEYIVCRLVNSQLWYYSSFANREIAEKELERLEEFDDNVVIVRKETVDDSL